MPASCTSTRSPRPLALRTRRDEAVRTGSGRCCALRHNPELHSQVRPATTVDCCYASSLDTARVDEIVLSTVGTSLSFTGTATISDDRRCGAGCVLQLNRVVVESGFLIVELDIAILVKLRRLLRWRFHRGRARRCPRTRRVEASELDCCGNALTTEAGS